MQGNCGECECRWSCEIDPEKCNEWPDPVPMTNADRIRAMSDEALTDSWIRDNTICHRCAYRDESECDEFVTNEKCREGILEWHKQPVEDK